VHLHHVHVPAVLLSVVYAAAVAVAMTAPGEHTLAGLIVLAGLVTRLIRPSSWRLPRAPGILQNSGSTRSTPAAPVSARLPSPPRSR
jgi:hypothetical protein